MINYPEENAILDRQYWLDKAQGKFVFPENFKGKKNKKLTEKALKEEKIKGCFYFAPEHIKKDREIVLLGLEKSYEYLTNVDDSLIDKEFILEYVDRIKYPSFFSIPKNFQFDDDIFLNILAKNYSAFSYYCWEMKENNKYANKEGIKKLLKINSHIIRDLSDFYKNDLEIAKIALDEDPNNIQYLNKKITEKICIDKEYCKDLLSKNINAFPYINLKLRGDKDFVIPYIKRNYTFLKNVSKKLRCDKSFMEQFINQTIFFIDCVGDNLLKDEELMLKAVKSYPGCLYKVDDSLKNKDFYIKAIKLNPKVYNNLFSEFQLDDDIIYHTLMHDTFYNNKYEKESTVNLIHINKLESAQKEYNELHKNDKECIDFDSYVRKKYINLYLTNNLYCQDSHIKPKRLKL